jgi:thioredoxin
MKIYKYKPMRKIVYYTVLVGISLAFIQCSGSAAKKADPGKKDTTAQKAVMVTAEQAVPVHLNKAEFLKRVMDYEKNTQQWKFAGSRPCLVDFYANWCGPCRITSPILEDLAKKYSGKIDIYKVNIDEEQELASIFGIQNIPTFLFCPLSGNPVITSGIANTPAATREMVINQIEEILLKSLNNAESI